MSIVQGTPQCKVCSPSSKNKHAHPFTEHKSIPLTIPGRDAFPGSSFRVDSALIVEKPAS